MKILGYVVFGIVVLTVMGQIHSCLTTKRFDQTELVRELNDSGGITGLIRDGVFHKIEVREGGISVVVGPLFYRLPFEKKAMFVKTVAGFVGPDRGGDHFILYDWRTDKKIGAWRGEQGLNLE
jgi:hypothetical protein